ncbi:Uncharacterised protein [Mycobacteroides abscessus subsp. abscessus]|nr:Uncharacterised protein [Mycobacteroides abscessus subsp. abscessus]
MTPSSVSSGSLVSSASAVASVSAVPSPPSADEGVSPKVAGSSRPLGASKI